MLSARDLHPSGKALISLAASSNAEIDLYDGYLNQASHCDGSGPRGVA